MEEFNMSLENMLLDVTMTLVDKDIYEKAGQLRYTIKDTHAEIFDTYLFPDYRRKKIMTNLLKKIIPGLKATGISVVKLKYFDDDARVAWERMGFRHVDKEGNMELDI
jgi:GNAT superfamily N-acetyltransferase